MSDDNKKGMKELQLDQTIGSVSTGDLDAARKHVTAQIEAAHAKLAERESQPEPKRGTLTSMTLPMEEATIIDDDSVSTEDERLAKLDTVTDVLLVLVDKYRRAAKLLWVVIVLVLGLIAVVTVAILFVADVAEQVTQVTDKQEKMIEAQAEANRKADEAVVAVAETKKAVDETAKKVDEAVEASPKLVVDEKGKVKVVVPVKRKEPPKHKGHPKPGMKGAKKEAPKKAEFPVILK